MKKISIVAAVIILMIMASVVACNSSQVPSKNNEGIKTATIEPLRDYWEGEK